MKQFWLGLHTLLDCLFVAKVFEKYFENHTIIGVKLCYQHEGEVESSTILTQHNTKVLVLFLETRSFRMEKLDFL